MNGVKTLTFANRYNIGESRLRRWNERYKKDKLFHNNSGRPSLTDFEADKAIESRIVALRLEKRSAWDADLDLFVWKR